MARPQASAATSGIEQKPLPTEEYIKLLRAITGGGGEELSDIELRDMLSVIRDPRFDPKIKVSFLHPSREQSPPQSLLRHAIRHQAPVLAFTMLVEVGRCNLMETYPAEEEGGEKGVVESLLDFATRTDSYTKESLEYLKRIALLYAPLIVSTSLPEKHYTDLLRLMIYGSPAGYHIESNLSKAGFDPEIKVSYPPNPSGEQSRPRSLLWHAINYKVVDDHLSKLVKKGCDINETYFTAEGKIANLLDLALSIGTYPYVLKFLKDEGLKPTNSESASVGVTSEVKKQTSKVASSADSNFGDSEDDELSPSASAKSARGAELSSLHSISTTLREIKEYVFRYITDETTKRGITPQHILDVNFDEVVERPFLKIGQPQLKDGALIISGGIYEFCETISQSYPFINPEDMSEDMSKKLFSNTTSRGR